MALKKSKGKITVRIARKSDILGIVEIGSKTFPLSRITKQIIEERISKNHVFLVAFYERKLAGFVDIRLGKTGAFISGIATASDARGRGIGTALLEKSIEYSRKNGKFEMELRVIAKNMRAVSLYKKHGFVVLGVRSRKDDLLIYRMYRSTET